MLYARNYGDTYGSRRDWVLRIAWLALFFLDEATFLPWSSPPRRVLIKHIRGRATAALHDMSNEEMDGYACWIVGMWES